MVVVYVLAVVGGAVIALWLARTWSGSWRVLTATNEFQAASVAAIAAIREQVPTHPSIFAALGRWEASRSAIRELTADQQRIAVETLRERGFPIQEVAEAITEFMEATDRENSQFDNQLASLGARR